MSNESRPLWISRVGPAFVFERGGPGPVAGQNILAIRGQILVCPNEIVVGIRRFAIGPNPAEQVIRQSEGPADLNVSRLRVRAVVFVHQPPVTALVRLGLGQLRDFSTAMHRSNLTTEEHRVVGFAFFAQPLSGHRR